MTAKNVQNGIMAILDHFRNTHARWKIMVETFPDLRHWLAALVTLPNAKSNNPQKPCYGGRAR